MCCATIPRAVRSVARSRSSSGLGSGSAREMDSGRVDAVGGGEVGDGEMGETIGERVRRRARFAESWAWVVVIRAWSEWMVDRSLGWPRLRLGVWGWLGVVSSV